MEKPFFATAAALTLGLAGCTSAPSKYQPPEVDNTPTHTTAVIHANSEVQGSLLPDFRGTQVVYTRDDRRTIEGTSTMDSWWGKMLVSDLHNADIFRLDQNRAMMVDFNQREYYECDIAECPSLINLLNAASRPEQAETEQDTTYEPEDSGGCALTLTEHTFTVKDTGQSKTLNGYPAKLYAATWELTQEDSNQRQNHSTLKIDFWTTPPTGEMQEIWAIHKKVTDAYVKQANLENNPLAEFLPEDIFRTLSAFSGDTDSSSQAWNNEVSQKLATVKGYPLSIDLNWYRDAEACPEDKPQAADVGASSNPLDSLKDVAGSVVGDAVKEQFTPDASEPVLTYRYHVTSASIDQVHDSVFEVPDGFSQKPLPRWAQDEK